MKSGVEAVASELMTVPETAQFFRVTVSTIRSWVLYRKIPFVKVGGRLVRFRRADLERVVSAKVVPAKAGAR